MFNDPSTERGEDSSSNYGGKRSRQQHDHEELTTRNHNHYCSDHDNTNCKKSKIYNEEQEHCTILILDHLNNNNCRVFKLLKSKFTKQQLGKKLWLENRELQYDFIPIEFSKDKHFIMNFIKRMTTHHDACVRLLYTERCQYQCWEQIGGDILKNDIDMIFNFAFRSLKHKYLPPTSLITKIDKYCNEDERRGVKFLLHLFNTILNYSQIYVIKQIFTFTKKIATNQELLLEFIKLEYKIFEFADDESLKNDRNFLLNSVSANPDVFYLLDPIYHDDKEIVLSTIKAWRGGADNLLIEFVSNRLKQDRDVILECGKKEIDFLKYADTGYENDREFALQMVQCNGKSLKYFSDNIKNDREVVLAAIRNGGHIIDASEELQLDRELVLESVKYNGSNFIFLSETYQKDREIALTAVKNLGRILKYVCPQDREIVLEAVKQAGTALEYADESFKKDREIVLEAIRTQRGRALKYASEELQNDLDILLEAVEKYGREVLDFRSSMNEETALKLVKQDGLLLEYLPNEFKSDNEIVLAAIQQNPISILFSEVDDREENKKHISKAIGMIHSKYPTRLLQEKYFKKIKDIELAYQLVKYNPLAIHYLKIKKMNEKIGYRATLLENGLWDDFSEDAYQERIIYGYHAAKIDNDEINYYRNSGGNKLWTDEMEWCKWCNR